MESNNLEEEVIGNLENADVDSNFFKDKETNDIKFPTFDIPCIEELLKTDISYQSIILELKSCDEGLNYILKIYDTLMLENINGEYIKMKIMEHNRNHISFKIYALIIHRQILLLFYLLENKFNKIDKDKYMTHLINDYLNIDEDILVANLLDSNRSYFIVRGSIDNQLQSEQRLEVIQMVQNLIRNEKNLVEFELNNPNFEPSLTSLNLSLKIIKYIIDELSKQVSQFLSSEKKKIKEEQLIVFFHNFSKLEILSNFFILTYKIPKDDIFNLPENSSTWEEIKKHFERKVIFSRFVINKKLKQVYNMVILSNASVSKGYNKFDSSYLKMIGTSIYFAYFFFNKKKANIQSLKFSINPSFEIAREIWNILDTKAMRNILKITLPSVKYSKSWFIRKTECEINFDKIKQLIEISNDYEKYTNNSICLTHNELICMNESLVNHYLENMLVNQNLNSQSDNSNLILKNVKEENKNDYVKIKIISFKELFVKNSRDSILKYFSCVNREKTSNNINSIIIHIHGGGFVAMSPSSHENYTRKWTNDLHVPVFSIDYRLAPEHPYPKALDDVYQVYMWIIKYSENIFKIHLDNIILVGDSAGGNLVVSLVYLLITMKKKLPTCMILAYPALKVSMSTVSSSYMNVLNDIILPFHLLKFCLESYRKNYTNEDDPFISPITMNNNIVKLLPPVRILCGSSDPLRDDSLLFLDKLIKLKVDVKMIELKYFPHGFLNYDYPLMMPEASVGSDIIIEEIRKFITVDKFHN